MSELGDKERRFVEDQRRVESGPKPILDLVSDDFKAGVEMGKIYQAGLFAEKDAEIERLKAILDEDNTIKEDAIICCDCGQEAGPSCDYFGHGLAELSALIDAFSNPIESADTRALLAEAAEVLAVVESILFEMEPPTKPLRDVTDTATVDEMVDWWEEQAKPLRDKLEGLQ